jgi:CBS domain-containing protein
LSLEAKISGLMKGVVHKIHHESTVAEAAAVLLAKDIGSLVVMGANGPVGLITARDILRKVTTARADPAGVRVRDVMSSPLISVGAGASVGEAAKKMIDMKIKRLGVTDDQGGLAGIVTMTDIVGYVAKQEELSDSLIRYLMHVV